MAPWVDGPYPVPNPPSIKGIRTGGPDPNLLWDSRGSWITQVERDLESSKTLTCDLET